MAWRKLHRSDLDVICGEFGIDCGKHLKKAEVIRAMEASRDDEEIVELWEDIKKKGKIRSASAIKKSRNACASASASTNWIRSA